MVKKDVLRICPRLEVFQENKMPVRAADCSTLCYCAEMNYSKRIRHFQYRQKASLILSGRSMRIECG